MTQGPLKKLQNYIWKFRTKYAGLQIGLLAFCGKTDHKETFVVTAHFRLTDVK
ncbi:MAG: hypothetical protein P4L34_13310 [Paludibacter sp.]|nr:hypothetical protein [Paludibacter sp.]